MHIHLFNSNISVHQNNHLCEHVFKKKCELYKRIKIPNN